MNTALTLSAVPNQAAIVDFAKSFCPYQSTATGNAAGSSHPFLFGRIAHLFSTCSPSTVARFVVSIVINSIKGMNFGWAQSHIGQEVIELVPSFTDSDSSCAITVKHWLACIAASTIHIKPCPIFWRATCAPFSESMFIEHDNTVTKKVAWSQ